jgi:hypothetical protein
MTLCSLIFVAFFLPSQMRKKRSPMKQGSPPRSQIFLLASTLIIRCVKLCDCWRKVVLDQFLAKFFHRNDYSYQFSTYKDTLSYKKMTVCHHRRPILVINIVPKIVLYHLVSSLECRVLPRSLLSTPHNGYFSQHTLNMWADLFVRLVR